VSSSLICAKCGTASAGTGKVLCGTCLENLARASANFWEAAQPSSTDTTVTADPPDATQFASYS
jgi:hypothetical protein